jgi:uncharacterized membrane protein YagU involved in acid resistance
MKLIPAILGAGFAAGLGDIAYACIHYNLVYGTPPEVILQSVAAGVVGKNAAAQGGWGTAAMGLAAHFVLALIMAAVFIVVAQLLPPLKRFWQISGPFYGLGLMFLMNMVIVPMSAAGGPGELPKGEFLYGAIFAHTILVGLVIAWFANRVRKG